MDAYKSPVAKLNSFFEHSHDKWKRRSAEKQKTIRAQQTTIRDLQRSRDRWKERAMLAEKRAEELAARPAATELAAGDASSF